MVDVAQLVESRIVIPVVAGSSPVVHPIFPSTCVVSSSDALLLSLQLLECDASGVLGNLAGSQVRMPLHRIVECDGQPPYQHNLGRRILSRALYSGLHVIGPRQQRKRGVTLLAICRRSLVPDYGRSTAHMLSANKSVVTRSRAI